jgi:hypothetical protein
MENNCKYGIHTVFYIDSKSNISIGGALSANGLLEMLWEEE